MLRREVFPLFLEDFGPASCFFFNVSSFVSSLTGIPSVDWVKSNFLGRPEVLEKHRADELADGDIRHVVVRDARRRHLFTPMVGNTRQGSIASAVTSNHIVCEEWCR